MSENLSIKANLDEITQKDKEQTKALYICRIYYTDKPSRTYYSNTLAGLRGIIESHLPSGDVEDIFLYRAKEFNKEV